MTISATRACAHGPTRTSILHASPRRPAGRGRSAAGLPQPRGRTVGAARTGIPIAAEPTAMFMSWYPVASSGPASAHRRLREMPLESSKTQCKVSFISCHHSGSRRIRSVHPKRQDSGRRADERTSGNEGPGWRCGRRLPRAKGEKGLPGKWRGTAESEDVHRLQRFWDVAQPSALLLPSRPPDRRSALARAFVVGRRLLLIGVGGLAACGIFRSAHGRCGLGRPLPQPRRMPERVDGIVLLGGESISMRALIGACCAQR